MKGLNYLLSQLWSRQNLSSQHAVHARYQFTFGCVPIAWLHSPFYCIFSLLHRIINRTWRDYLFPKLWPGQNLPSQQAVQDQYQFTFWLRANCMTALDLLFIVFSAFCIEELTEHEGTIYSPNYGQGRTYPPNRQCQWTIRVKTGYYATFLIHRFDVEKDTGGQCLGDVLGFFYADGDTIG